VLELPGSAAALADLAKSNLLLVPLDRQGQWCRAMDRHGRSLAVRDAARP
jgi:hypothetical protein